MISSRLSWKLSQSYKVTGSNQISWELFYSYVLRYVSKSCTINLSSSYRPWVKWRGLPGTTYQSTYISWSTVWPGLIRIFHQFPWYIWRILVYICPWIFGNMNFFRISQVTIGRGSNSIFGQTLPPILLYQASVYKSLT